MRVPIPPTARIDIHSHAGVSLKAYARMEYPYAATIEGLYYRQLKGKIDINVVFPLSPDLYFDLNKLIKKQNRVVAAKVPLSKTPYAVENELLLRELYDYCPELTQRFLPFVCVDPRRAIASQIEKICELCEKYRIFGIKIVPPLCQSPITALLSEGKPLLDLARKHDWPVMLHTTCYAAEHYSRADLAFKVILRNPDVRFCLAHCIGFHRDFLGQAARLKNVWIDTSALKIQVLLAAEENPIVAAASRRFEADYSSHIKVMRALADAYPDKIIWGTDSPAYAYICRRRQAAGVISTFKLKACYEDEIAALDALPPDLQQKVCNFNSRAFLFGGTGEK